MDKEEEEADFMCQKYRFQFREERALFEKRMICKISGSKSVLI